ncbi:uncharacterized protein Dana_GF27255 [Drosophila ananassae]|uniref:SCP domain-containing protein n=1 Tax=Drosophila ananassae TaxID=7217 RepID=A0A0P8YGD4_DROAN|nr:uncharacterized protein Dana_GF27255 [Drosophila ananassae]
MYLITLCLFCVVRYSFAGHGCYQIKIPTKWNKNYGPEDVVDEINSKRKSCGSPPLTYSKTLSDDANAYIQHLNEFGIGEQLLYTSAAAKNSLNDHIDYPLSDPNKENFTENICEYSGQKHFFVEYWFEAGLRAYRYHPDDRVPEVRSLADKYTAMMWKSSEYIGVALAEKKNSKPKTRTIVVVRFSPPGNQDGQYLKNVPVCNRPHGNCSKSSTIYINKCFLTVAILSLLCLFK